ncbi:MAG: DEAD/DEAH box helicase, partial [Candidatus Methylomirabilia bacterium]
MLADDMGLGKTVEAIAACALLRELRDVGRVLVVCPASLKHQWAREIRKLTTFPVSIVEGAMSRRREVYARSSFFTILNYEVALRDEPILERMRPDIIILDEAQRIKNWRAKTADAVKRLRSRYAFVLTGTPLENRLDELYSILQFLDPRTLGPLWKFNERYFQLERRKDGSHKVLGYKNLDELRSRIAPVVLRRAREEVLQELPGRLDNHFFVELTPPQRDAYDGYAAIVARLFAISQRRPLTPQERNRLLKSLIKMRIICDALALHDPTLPQRERERTAPKLAELRNILEDQVAGNGAKALVFSQWAGMLALAEPGLRRMGLGYVKLTGAVPSSRRGRLIEQFFEDDRCRVFLSTDAGGVGLNLQAASLVVNLDLPWNPAVLDQRSSRAHRHGQPRTVTVVSLIARDTIEERMLDTLAAKRHVFEGVFGTEEAPTTVSFRDTGQQLLRRLGDFLEPQTRPERPADVISAEGEAPAIAPLAPTLRVFAEMLVSRFPGRILLVRWAPPIGGPARNRPALVVVDREPAELRPPIEALLREHFGEEAVPGLHLMEREGYRTLLALAGELGRQGEEEAYRAPALPAAFADEGRELRLRRAREALEHAAKRLRFAEVVIAGGFPEEALHPLREALGWGLTAGLTLVKDREPGPELPSPREVESELVGTGRLPEELAGRLSRIRELTEPPEGDTPSPPPSGETLTTLVVAVRELIEAGEQQVTAKRL